MPKWIAQEKSHAQQDRELYRRELVATRDSGGPSVPDEQTAAKQAALNRQIAEQIRLLLQLKSKRSLWGSESEAEEPAASADPTAENPQTSDGQRSLDHAFRCAAVDSQETITKGDGVGFAKEAIGEKMAQRTDQPTRRFRIKELTCGTNLHEPKTKPLSPLDLMGVLKRTQNQANKSFRFATLLKRTQLLRVPPPHTQEPQDAAVPASG